MFPSSFGCQQDHFQVPSLVRFAAPSPLNHHNGAHCEEEVAVLPAEA